MGLRRCSEGLTGGCGGADSGSRPGASASWNALCSGHLRALASDRGRLDEAMMIGMRVVVWQFFLVPKKVERLSWHWPGSLLGVPAQIGSGSGHGIMCCFAQHLSR